ncbi:unnamed protein product, partial [Effrenium voratum]
MVHVPFPQQAAQKLARPRSMAQAPQAAALASAWANEEELAALGAKQSLCQVTAKKLSRRSLKENYVVVGLAVKHLGMRPSQAVIDQAVFSFLALC